MRASTKSKAVVADKSETLEQPAKATRKSKGKQHDPVSLPVEEIAAKAYALWQQRGCVHGHDQQDWLLAEDEIRKKYSSA